MKWNTMYIEVIIALIREKYLSQIIGFYDSNLIKILVGIEDMVGQLY